ncbi:hypothetical protein R83H12_00406 [Fibrobacteria bacterium R8-3-H12]
MENEEKGIIGEIVTELRRRVRENGADVIATFISAIVSFFALMLVVLIWIGIVVAGYILGVKCLERFF